eukprot:CAMPEP_0171073566 /NCGR_PEP_ID=MMETSP0766_2-20121228/11588_1 /TAXON_ID=439317 /ORGANISM="Gambierdiscus australes, Strain CAWD 149" /LENGTH=66 /DNA_ID=CAMNT_0011530271 /DNA_START=135 /DNA_END=335 /DNA_ORIENTATION=-
MEWLCSVLPPARQNGPRPMQLKVLQELALNPGVLLVPPHVRLIWEAASQVQTQLSPYLSWPQRCLS